MNTEDIENAMAEGEPFLNFDMREPKLVAFLGKAVRIAKWELERIQQSRAFDGR